jgi:sensor histidine kinase YesM/ligand-binding sensor domain-containing protein
MRRFFVILLLILFALINTDVFSHEFFVQNIGKEKGFDRANYISIFQDKAGFLWLSTQKGLIQYSGGYTRVYKPGAENTAEIKAEYFYDVIENKDQELWIATRNGLLMMDASRKNIQTFEKEFNNPTSIPNNRIFSLLPYNDSTLFLACDRSGIIKFHTKAKTAEQITPIPIGFNELPANFWVREYYHLADTLVLIRTNNFYYAFNAVNNTIILLDQMFSELKNISRINNLYMDEIRHFWFTDSKGIVYKWVPEKGIKAIEDRSLSASVLKGEMRFHDFDNRHILITTLDQNYLLERDLFDLSEMTLRSDGGDDFSRTVVTALHKTPEGNIFLAFRNGQLGQINPLFQNSVFKELLPNGNKGPVYAAFILDDTLYQKRYITTFVDSVIFVEDLKDGQTETILKQSFGNNSSNQLLIDSKQRLWICQGDGLLEVDRATRKTRYHKPDVPAAVLFTMAEISQGVFMVGSFRNGLFYFEPDKGIFKKMPETNGWISTQIFEMKYDPSRNVLWIGTVRNGLFRYDVKKNTFTQFMPDLSNPSSIGGDWVRSIVIDSAGYIWMAVDPVGLCRYDYNASNGNEFLNFSLNDGLPSNHISGMVVDRYGKIWMTSLNGLSSFDPETFQCVNYVVENGIYNNTFFYANLSINSQNILLAGTERGYLEINPKSMLSNSVPPKVRLVDFSVVAKDLKRNSISTDEAVKLKHYENYLIIDFAVINFTDPDRNTVYYTLDKDPSDWQMIKGINQIVFSNLSPGKYNFRLKAKNGDGIWSENIVSIPITIKPPFWLSWWFHSMLWMLLGLLVYLAFRYRLQQTIKAGRLEAEKNLIKTTMEKEMAALEMTALRSQMNPHFIFNCLNSINRFIIVNDNDTASEYLTKFSRLIRQVLDNSRSEKISLAKEIDTVKLYIEMEKLRYADKFDFSITIEPELFAEKILIQPMLIQPYVENAIWHGLMHKNGEGRIDITLSNTSNRLKIDITDDGIGRKRSMELKSKQMIHNSSYGMKVTAQRMAMLNKKVNEKSEVIITDLYDNDSNATGTRVVLLLPVDHGHIEETELSQPNKL